MCGICGVIGLDARPIDEKDVGRACSLLRHRGPDHLGLWTLPLQEANAPPTVCLGATRLAVLDPTAVADQPFHRGGRHHLVYNGELYNFREVRDELAEVGESFVTEGDTEVVLAACARWGADALQRFNGMWALAYYDSHSRRGFLGRDPLGIKPLFYASGGGRLAFASELQAMAPLGDWDRAIDQRALASHLVFGFIAHPATILRGVRRLPPGHWIAFGPEVASEPQRFHQWSKSSVYAVAPDHAATCAALRRRVAGAVAQQRAADVPLGAFLSGGLDSSIIALHLAESTPQPIRTFCVGFDEHMAYDERRHARRMAERIGSRHEEVILTQRNVLDAIPRILDHLAEPVGDSSIIPTALISQAARRFVTVALSGDGGDELFGGYWRYSAHASLEGYRRIPAPIRSLLLEPLLRMMGVSRSSSLGNRVRQFGKLLRARGEDAFERHAAWSRILAPDAEGLFRDPLAVKDCEDAMVALARRINSGRPEGDPLNNILLFDLQNQLPADMLQKVDLASMMHSLEVRVPLLDQAVVEFALGLPSRFKIDRGLRKRILLDAYRGILPDETLDRPKQGFEVPVGEYFRGPLRELFHDTVTRETVGSFEVLSYSAIESIVADHRGYRADHADLLWALLSLCWWRRTRS